MQHIMATWPTLGAILTVTRTRSPMVRYREITCKAVGERGKAWEVKVLKQWHE